MTVSLSYRNFFPDETAFCNMSGSERTGLDLGKTAMVSVKTWSRYSICSKETALFTKMTRWSEPSNELNVIVIRLRLATARLTAAFGTIFDGRPTLTRFNIEFIISVSPAWRELVQSTYSKSGYSVEEVCQSFRPASGRLLHTKL
jgi:hypothetical protein